MYFSCEIVIEYLSLMISMPTIFAGSPRSVTSPSDQICSFILSIKLSLVVNNNKLSTYTVIISNPLLFVTHMCMGLILKVGIQNL